MVTTRMQSKHFSSPRELIVPSSHFLSSPPRPPHHNSVTKKAVSEVGEVAKNLSDERSCDSSVAPSSAGSVSRKKNPAPSNASSVSHKVDCAIIKILTNNWKFEEWAKFACDQAAAFGEKKTPAYKAATNRKDRLKTLKEKNPSEFFELCEHQRDSLAATKTPTAATPQELNSFGFPSPLLLAVIQQVTTPTSLSEDNICENASSIQEIVNKTASNTRVWYLRTARSAILYTTRGAYLCKPEVHIFCSQKCISFFARGAYLL